MNQRERDELIEAAARHVAGINADLDPDDEMVTSVLPMYLDDVEHMIRFFNERGFDLCKLPNKLGGPIAAPNGDGTHGYFLLGPWRTRNDSRKKNKMARKSRRKNRK